MKILCATAIKVSEKTVVFFEFNRHTILCHSIKLQKREEKPIEEMTTRLRLHSWFIFTIVEKRLDVQEMCSKSRERLVANDQPIETSTMPMHCQFYSSSFSLPTFVFDNQQCHCNGKCSKNREKNNEIEQKRREKKNVYFLVQLCTRFSISMPFDKTVNGYRQMLLIV